MALYRRGRSGWSGTASLSQFHDRVLRDPVAVRYPPPPDYTRRVAKALVGACDAEHVELYEPLLELLFGGSAPSRGEGGEGGALRGALGYRTFTFGPGATVVALRCTEESFGGGAETSTVVWPAGRHLAAYLCAHPALLKGRRVVELGCGCGTVGLAVRPTLCGLCCRGW